MATNKIVTVAIITVLVILIIAVVRYVPSLSRIKEARSVR